MSDFVTTADYLPYIKSTRLTQMLDTDTAAVEDAEDTATAIIRDALYSRYDVDAIFALTGAARPKQVIRWAVCLVLYYLHQRLPDSMVPERVTKDYEDTLETLTQIEDAQKSVNLPLLTAPEGHAFISKFRWGSDTPRGHNY